MASAPPAVIEADDLPPADPQLPAGDPPAADPVIVADPPASDPPPNDDWRSRLAGDDKEALGWLGRYQSESAFVAAAKKDRDALRNGKFIKPLADGATEQEVAEYRAHMGVPEKAADYLESLPDGLVVGDDDRPAVDVFVEKMHAANAPKGVTDAALAAYYEIVESQMADQAEATEQAKAAGIDALRGEWGADYRRNLTVMNNHLSLLPEAVQDVFKHGTMSDGTPIGYHPEVLKWVTGLALEANPVATVVPGAGANQANAIADEIATIEKTMRENRSTYNRDDKMQARYRELLGAREKLKA